MKEEISKHDDMIVANFEDTFFNDTMKKFYSFVWASTFCRKSEPVILFLDRGDAFNADKLTEVLDEMPLKKRKSLLHGHLRYGDEQFSEDELKLWSTSKEEVAFPTYPPYLDGRHMLVGFETLQRIALGMYFTKIIHTADAWVGMAALRSGLPVLDMKEITNSKTNFIRHL